MPQILAVDDEPDFLEVLTPRLESAGYQVIKASDGKEAIGMYVHSITKNDPIHLILLDIMMPGMSGIEALEAIRKEEELRGIPLGRGVPIIMLTALKRPFMDSFNRGCDDYIIKPFNDVDLLNKIDEKLKMSGAIAS